MVKSQVIELLHNLITIKLLELSWFLIEQKVSVLLVHHAYPSRLTHSNWLGVACRLFGGQFYFYCRVWKIGEKLFENYNIEKSKLEVSVIT